MCPRSSPQSFLDFVSSRFEVRGGREAVRRASLLSPAPLPSSPALTIRPLQVILFTASHPSYANPLLDRLDPGGRYFSHRLFFDSCLLVDGTYVKDLSVLGRDLRRTAIVDNTPYTYGFQPDNAVPILSWFDQDEDAELASLLPLFAPRASFPSL